MIAKILEKLKGEKEKVNLELGSFEDFFEDKRGEKLQRIDRESESLRERTQRVMDDLEKVLEEVEGFEDEKGRSVIDDVVSNVVEERKKLVADFETPANIESLEKRLRKFLEDYQEITQKEGAVIEEAGLEKKFGESLKEVKELHEEMNKFVEEEYQTRKNLEEIRNKLRKIEKNEQKLVKLEERLEETDPEKIEKKIEEKEEMLEKINDSEAMEKLEDLREELEEAKSEKNELERKISKSTSRMQRGLKKLLYEGEIGKVSRRGSEVLREIRDQDEEGLMKEDAEIVEEAVKAVRDSLGDELEEKTEEKLLNGIDELENFSETREEIKELDNRIEQLEKKIDSHKAKRKKEEVKRQIDRLREKLEDKKQEREKTREEIESNRCKIDDLRKDIGEILEDEFNRPVELN